MKINQIIREKRKALSLTQEQVADFLGVSAAAVNKWEKGSTYPDITLLPALARLLKTDLNTLLSFREDLTAAEIEAFVDGLDQTVQQEGYPAAFARALDKIHEYPTCEALAYSAMLYLDGARSLFRVAEPEQYQATFETFYQRLSASEDPEIRDTALSMLISGAMERGAYAEAEEQIRKLPCPSIDREELLAVLYQRQGKHADAEPLWERRVAKGVTEIQTALIHMMETALYEGRDADADFFADRYEELTRQFAFPEWMRYNAHLYLALERKDADGSLSLLAKMLPAMKDAWNAQDHWLYRHLEGDSVTWLSGRVADSFCEELQSKEEYSFLRAHPQFGELMARFRDRAGT